MKTNFLSLAVIVLMIVGSIGAVGTNLKTESEKAYKINIAGERESNCGSGCSTTGFPKISLPGSTVFR